MCCRRYENLGYGYMLSAIRKAWHGQTSFCVNKKLISTVRDETEMCEKVAPKAWNGDISNKKTPSKGSAKGTKVQSHNMGTVRRSVTFVGGPKSEAWGDGSLLHERAWVLTTIAACVHQKLQLGVTVCHSETAFASSRTARGPDITGVIPKTSMVKSFTISRGHRGRRRTSAPLGWGSRTTVRSLKLFHYAGHVCHLFSQVTYSSFQGGEGWPRGG